MHDRRLIFAAAFLRALATGMAGVLLGLTLARLGFSAAAIGAVLSAGLAGATLALVVVTWAGDRIGRRRCLLGLSLLGAAGGLGAALVDSPLAMAAAAFVGILNGMGRDRGAALVLEQAILPATVDDAGRTGAFARYNLLTDIGHALGALLAAAPTLLAGLGVDETQAFRGMFLLYAGLLAAGAPLALALSPAAETGAGTRQSVSPESRKIVLKISALFAIDSIAGGFLGSALLSYFFFERFAVSAAWIGSLFFAARVLNALSHLGAAWLAARIGLVNTMVFTHIPSSVLLASVAFAPNFGVAALLFLLREGLVEMDVPTRQSYVMAVVAPEERTWASGVTHLVRLGGWAVAPAFAGWLMQAAALAAPLIIGAGMKIAYDLMLWRAFRKLKPPEERECIERTG
ncbi:MAG: MFS transporter [Zoogloeaceae bacterium]|nr:MFS transporter [Zoogloeaceae bacterium]MCK6383877.1 MFS transporter [Rhodocyclaceae bacterium]